MSRRIAQVRYCTSSLLVLWPLNIPRVAFNPSEFATEKLGRIMRQFLKRVYKNSVGGLGRQRAQHRTCSVRAVRSISEWEMLRAIPFVDLCPLNGLDDDLP